MFHNRDKINPPEVAIKDEHRTSNVQHRILNKEFCQFINWQSDPPCSRPSRQERFHYSMFNVRCSMLDVHLLHHHQLVNSFHPCLCVPAPVCVQRTGRRRQISQISTFQFQVSSRERLPESILLFSSALAGYSVIDVSLSRNSSCFFTRRPKTRLSFPAAFAARVMLPW